MAVSTVLRMGDARLLQYAEPVSDFGGGALRSLIEDMRDTMQALDGVGLAAPQIGVNLRVVIFSVPTAGQGSANRHGASISPNHESACASRFPHPPSTGSGQAKPPPQAGEGENEALRNFHGNPRYPDAQAVPETVLINPVITALDEIIEDDWEGCLSLPGLRGLVPRFNHIRYQGYDEQGAPIDRTVSGFHARVVQHECDHLDGILYPMRMRNLSKFGFREELFPGQAMQDE